MTRQVVALDRSGQSIAATEHVRVHQHIGNDFYMTEVAEMLTAVDLGLGALFFAIFAGEQDLMDALGVPVGYRPIGAIAVGHPSGGERSEPELSTGRRRPGDVVRWEHW